MKLKLIIALVVLFSCILLFLSAQILKGIFFLGLSTILGLLLLGYGVYWRVKKGKHNK